MSTSIAANPNIGSSGLDGAMPLASSAPVQEDSASTAPAPVAASNDAPRFISPVIKVDNDTGLALLVVLDSNSGKEVSSYPSRMVVEEYSRRQAAKEVKVESTADGAQSIAAAAKAPPAPVASVAPVSSAPAPTAPVGTGTSSVSASSRG